MLGLVRFRLRLYQFRYGFASQVLDLVPGTPARCTSTGTPKFKSGKREAEGMVEAGEPKPERSLKRCIGIGKMTTSVGALFASSGTSFGLTSS